MRSDTRARPAARTDAGRDPTRAAALRRLAAAAPAGPSGQSTPPPDPGPLGSLTAPWVETDPEGRRPERIPPADPDLEAWADPPWWRRVRWAPDRIGGIALVVLVIALGAFSVHRLLSTVPAGPPVPELPMATPGVTVEAGRPDQNGHGAAVDASGTAPGDEPGTNAGEDAGNEIVVVSVVGMVGRSGLVTLPPGARVADALDHAGGVLDGGDRDGLNLARRVVDGEQILVGVAPGPEGPRGPRSDIVGPAGPVAPQARTGDAAGPAAGGSPGATPTGANGPVDLNTADAAALEALPGIGPVTAASILSWREANGPFSSVDQLTEVNGIGPATLARLRPLVTA